MLAFFAELRPCRVGMEASRMSHHWERDLIKLGHEVRLMPPADAKAYVNTAKLTLPMRKQSARQ